MNTLPQTTRQQMRPSVLLKNLTALLDSMRSNESAFDKEDAAKVLSFIDQLQSDVEREKQENALKACNDNIEKLNQIVKDRARVLDQHFETTLEALPELGDYFVQKQNEFQVKLEQYKELLRQESVKHRKPLPRVPPPTQHQDIYPSPPNHYPNAPNVSALPAFDDE